jgi:hypothetical protein
MVNNHSMIIRKRASTINKVTEVDGMPLNQDAYLLVCHRHKPQGASIMGYDLDR